MIYSREGQTLEVRQRMMLGDREFGSIRVGVSTLLWANWSNPYVWIVLGVTLSYGAIGFYDDYLKIKRRSSNGFGGWGRLALEFAIAAAAAFAVMTALRAREETGRDPVVQGGRRFTWAQLDRRANGVAQALLAGPGAAQAA